MHAMLLFSSPLLQFAARLPPLFLLLVSEHPPENLTRGTLGNNINKLNTARNPLVLRLVIFDVFLDLSRKHPVVLFDTYRGRLDNESLGDLSGPLVGYLDNSAVVYGRVGKEVGFEFGRCDLVSLGMVSWVGTEMQNDTYLYFDEFLYPVDDEDVFVSCGTLADDCLVSGAHVA